MYWVILLTFCIFDNFKNIRGKKQKKYSEKKKTHQKNELNSPEVDVYVYNNQRAENVKVFMLFVRLKKKSHKDKLGFWDH